MTADDIRESFKGNGLENNILTEIAAQLAELNAQLSTAALDWKSANKTFASRLIEALNRLK